MVFLNQPNGVFIDWTHAKVFAWLTIFGGFQPEPIGELIILANGNIGTLCLDIACKEQARDMVIKRWTPEMIREFTKHKARVALMN